MLGSNRIKFGLFFVFAVLLQSKAKAATIRFSELVSKQSVNRLVTAVAKKSASGDRNITIEFNSLGGDLAAALDAYPTIKKYHVNTSVETDCSSSCTVLFAAGVKRSASSSATFLFHNVKVDGTKKDFEEAGVDRATLQARYASQWLSAVRNVSPSLADFLSAQNTLVSGRDQLLSGSQLREFGFVND